MTDDDELFVLLSFPVAESMRAFLRTMLNVQQLPSLYRTGAKNLPCSECGMTLNVGPRSLAAMEQNPTTKLVCPICLPYVTKKGHVEGVLNLGNLESGWEGEN